MTRLSPSSSRYERHPAVMALVLAMLRLQVRRAEQMRLPLESTKS